MYLIANISSSDISISDLGITLKPNQSVDIHRIDVNLKPENSENLRLAIHKGFVKLLHRDGPVAPVPMTHVIQQTVNKGDLEKRDISELKDEILELKKKISEIGNNSVILEKLNELMSKTGNVPVASGNVSSVSGNVVKIPEVDEIDIDRMVNISQRGLKKLTKGVDGKIQFEQSNSEDDNVSKNISELEGLI